MATENVEAGSGSGGPRFASDTETVGTLSVNHPLFKVEWGEEDSFTLVNTGTASLPIQGAAAENAAVAGNPLLAAGRFDSADRTLGNGDVGAIALTAAGHQIVSGTVSVSNLAQTEDAVHGSGDTGIMPLAVRNDVLAALAGTDGDYAPFQVNASGALYTDVRGDALTALQLIDDPVFTLGSSTYTEATSKGNAIAAVRNDTLAALANTDNEFAPLQVSETGAVFVQDVGGPKNGLTKYRNVDVDETEDQVSANPVTLYTISAQSIDATPVYLHFYDATAASVTVGTTTPDLTFIIPSQGDGNGAGLVLDVSKGWDFSTALTIAATTTFDGSTGPGANEVIVNLGYKA